MHEKLTKLLELKEEGTISAAEYEEKKDALIGGRDIGALPEPKAPAKKKTPIEEEPIVEQEEHMPTEEENIPANENVSREDQDTQLSIPSLSGEAEPAVREVETEEKMQQSDDDKLKMLEEMRQEGLITEKDYESKKSKLADITEKSLLQCRPKTSLKMKVKMKRLKSLKTFIMKGLLQKKITNISLMNFLVHNNNILFLLLLKRY